MCGNRLQFYLGHLGMAYTKETGYFPEKRECSDKERNMAVGLCHSDKKSVCRNLQYNENVNMPDSPGWKWVQTVQTEAADRYLIRLKSREEGRARKTYRVEVKEDAVNAKSAPNVEQIVLLLLLLPLLGIIFAGLRYSLTSLNPQDDLQLVLILTVIAAILGLRIWLIQRKADKTLRYFLMTRIINAPGNRNGAYAGAAQRTANQTWGRTAYAEDAAYARGRSIRRRRHCRFGGDGRTGRAGLGGGVALVGGVPALQSPAGNPTCGTCTGGNHIFVRDCVPV